MDIPRLRHKLLTGLLATLLLSGTAALLGACHTAQGFGEDVSAAGQAVTDTADKVKDKL